MAFLETSCARTESKLTCARISRTVSFVSTSLAWHSSKTDPSSCCNTHHHGSQEKELQKLARMPQRIWCSDLVKRSTAFLTPPLFSGTSESMMQTSSAWRNCIQTWREEAQFWRGREWQFTHTKDMEEMEVDFIWFLVHLCFSQFPPVFTMLEVSMLRNLDLRCSMSILSRKAWCNAWCSRWSWAFESNFFWLKWSSEPIWSLSSLSSSPLSSANTFFSSSAATLDGV